jgi:hypothetical protein
MPEFIDPDDHPATSLDPSFATGAASLRPLFGSSVSINTEMGSGSDAGVQQ